MQDILQRFQPIGLEDLGQAALLNRIDSKFLIPAGLLPELLAEVSRDYKILEIDGNRIFHYETLYFDTSDNSFYREHHNGKKQRLKVRIRKYVESALAFLEVKQKNNKGRTLKSRIELDEAEMELSAHSLEFLRRVTGQPFRLLPKLWNSFRRITLVNEIHPERLTIDLGLAFYNGAGRHRLEGTITIELKQPKKSLHTPAAKALRSRGIREVSFSKYCVGSAILNPDLKSNNFKDKILLLDKIKSAYNHGIS